MNNVKKILTIIVPSYNTSKFVEQCVPTFCNDKLIGRIEVVFVDDGATDNTVELLEKFAKKTPSLFKIIRKENGGHGSAINYGVHKCVSTKYFKVIDGDDWVNTDNLIGLCNFLDETDADLVVTDFVKSYPEKEEIVICRKSSKLHSKNLLSNYLITIHSSTFKTSIFTSNNIKVREKVFYEDNEYVLFPMPYINSIDYFNKPVYWYRLGNATQSVSKEAMERNFKHACAVNDDISEYFKTIKQTKTNQNGFYEKFGMIIGNFQFKKIVLLLRSDDENANIAKQLEDFVKDFSNNNTYSYSWLRKNNLVFRFICNTNCKMIKTYRYLTRKMFR